MCTYKNGSSLVDVAVTVHADTSMAILTVWHRMSPCRYLSVVDRKPVRMFCKTPRAFRRAVGWL